MFNPSRMRILNTALRLFAEQGFAPTTMRQIATETGVSLGLAYRYYPSKEALVLALYRQLADAFVDRTSDLPEGTVAARFKVAMHQKLDLIEPHRAALTALFAHGMDPAHRLGVTAPQSAAVRSRVAGVFGAVVHGATQVPPMPARWARLLYGLHLSLILVWTQDTSEGSKTTREAVDLLAGTLDGLGPLLALLPGLEAGLVRIDDVFRDLLQGHSFAEPDELARLLALRLLGPRRVLPGVPQHPTEAALAVHLPVIAETLRQERPLSLVLPAFPAKAPSPTKTLGPLPDLAEQLAIDHLVQLVEDLSASYPPGAQLTICSDGHVFAETVGVDDATIDAYQAAMAERLAGTPLTLFDLRDVYPGLSGPEARERLLDEWGEDPTLFREHVATSASLQTMVDGIHRFLFEDALGLHPDWSRSQARKRTRDDAYEVVRRSRAWGALVGACFPDAIRLSIHPQADVSAKIGMHLVPVDDAWMTPWHGVALLDENGARLVKRADAEALGATQVPGSHYVVAR